MPSTIPPLRATPDLRAKASVGVGIAGALLLTPFAINNYLQGRHWLALGCVVIVVILGATSWSIRAGRDHSWLVLLGLVPIVLLFLVASMQTQGIIGVLWSYPSLLAFYFVLPERKAWVANAALLAILVPVAWHIVPPDVAPRVLATLVMASVFSAVFIRSITTLQDKLRLQVITDVLTGLHNRVELQQSLRQAIQQNDRTDVPMAMVTLDLDHFKAINDTFGHEVGDAVLHRIGQFLLARIRGTDRAFRLGGEEFLVLLHGANEQQARKVAEDIRTGIAALPLLADRPVTASLGVAAVQPNEDAATWMRRADQGLYRAKELGRNQVGPAS